MNARSTAAQGGAARYWARVRTEPGLFRNLGAIAFLLIVGTAFGGYFLVHERFNPPWEDKYSVMATFDESPAISPGNGQEVRIYGVQVGDIRSASVNDKAQAVVELKIDNKYPVYDNARAVLRPKSVLNEMYVELDPGNPSGRRLADGDVLPIANTSRPIQVNEALTDLDDNARYAITSLLQESDVALAHAPAELPGGLRETDKFLADIRPVTVELQKRKDTLARLITAVSRISSAAGADDERSTRLARSLQRTLDTVATKSGQFDASVSQLPDLSAQLHGATDAVTRLAGQLDPTLDSVRKASGHLPDALSRFHDSMDQLDGTLDSAAPVTSKAVGVVGDLRPALNDLNHGVDALKSTTGRLDKLTSQALPYLPDLQAFVYQTNSITSLTDANRGILRGQLTFSPETVPLAAPTLQPLLPTRR
jgi:phospholipid/cholesterol/gamma-HCH transport system substrate-binding protein